MGNPPPAGAEFIILVPVLVLGFLGVLVGSVLLGVCMAPCCVFWPIGFLFLLAMGVCFINMTFAILGEIN